MLFWYKIFCGFCWLLTLLPLRCLYLLSDLFFVVVCYVVRYRRKLLETWAELPPMFISSSAKKEGRDAILEFIERVLDN